MVLFLEFVMMPEFDRQWKRLGLGDEDLRRLQKQLLENPKAGSVIRGTGGLRKVRIAFPWRGKSGSGRLAYAKADKDTLSDVQRNGIANMIAMLERRMMKQELHK